MALIFRDVDIDGTLNRYYGRYIDIWEDISAYWDLIMDDF
jgi:hypothetical protein